MEIVLFVEPKNYQKVKDVLLKDEEVSKASIVFKDARNYGKEEGYYIYISGLEEQCKKALEIVKEKDEKGNTVELAKEVKDKEREKFIRKIKEEENKANEAFGGIFG